MKKTITAYKKIGESPLDLIKRLREERPELRDEKMAYAGRLDPMAEGLVLVVIGEELKNFDNYLKLDKEYEAKILFGFSSDTYDILGLVKKGDLQLVSEEGVKKTLRGIEGEFSFSLPPFSGYKIKGKPLFWWALENRLDEVRIPKKKTTVYSLDVLKTEWVKKKDLKKEVLRKIGQAKGSFRQEEISERWKKKFEKERREEDYLVVKIKVSCSSGCYVRSIANEVGISLGTGAVLLQLKRTKVGEETLKNT